MKKVMKVVLIIAGVIMLLLVGIVVLVLKVASAPFVEEGYYNLTVTGGSLEKTYTGMGDYEVGYAEYESADPLAVKYEIWYPKELETSDKKYPVVIFGNGTGVVASKYKPIFEHLASWGFIAVGDETQAAALGKNMSEALDFMIDLNGNQESVFCGKIDLDAIGVTGHSQGGFGAIRAALDYENSDMISSVFSISATTEQLLVQFNLKKDWGDYDTSRIHVPIFMVAGTGEMDAGSDKSVGISPLTDMLDNFGKITESELALMARKTGIDHTEMLRAADGYMTAWFLYTLTGDEEAGKAFVGERPELLENECWQDVYRK